MLSLVPLKCHSSVDQPIQSSSTDIMYTNFDALRKRHDQQPPQEESTNQPTTSSTYHLSSPSPAAAAAANNNNNNNNESDGGLLSLVATPARGSLWQHSIQSSSKRQSEKIFLDTLDGGQSNDHSNDNDNDNDIVKRARVASASTDNMMMKDSKSRT